MKSMHERNFRNFAQYFNFLCNYFKLFYLIEISRILRSMFERIYCVKINFNDCIADLKSQIIGYTRVSVPLIDCTTHFWHLLLCGILFDYRWREVENTTQDQSSYFRKY
jgi:hypothetical protein